MVTVDVSTADDMRVETSNGYDGLPPRVPGSAADPEPGAAPMSATVVFRSPGAAGYGRHAAPLSAYGPSDVHRLLPVPPVAAAAPERADSGVAPSEVMDSAVGAEVVALGGDGAGDRSSDEASTKNTGFWARLRLLPKTA